MDWVENHEVKIADLRKSFTDDLDLKEVALKRLLSENEVLKKDKESLEERL